MANHNTAVLETLRNCVFFRQLDDKAVASVADLVETTIFKKDDVVMREGVKDGNSFVVLEGDVDVLKRAPGGANTKAEDVKLIKLHRGDFVGLGAQLTDTPHNATVIAASDRTVLLKLSNERFAQLLAESPSVARGLLQYFAEELRRFRSQLVDAKGPEEGSNKSCIAFFDTKPYERPILQMHLDKTTDHNLNLKFFEVKLSKATVGLAAGAKAVCIFVNDICDSVILSQLTDMGVELVLLRCAGYNNVDLKAANALGISVAFVPKYSPYAVAEHASALILSLNRKAHIAYNRVKIGNFLLNGLVGFDMHGTTVGVIGTGKIGQCFIDIMLGYGCKILCFDKYPSDALMQRDTVQYTDLETVLSKCTILSLHAPLTEETKHLINKDTIAKMPRGVMIINTSRGALIDTESLVDGLKSGQVGYAGLDVYEREGDYFFQDRSADVLTDDVLARLLTFPNVIVTAHQAFLTEQALDAIGSITIQNAHEFFVEKKRLKHMTNSVNDKA